MHADVVIGANYGDEGKGLMTDYLCHANRSRLYHDQIVIRFCGGAQAGHTVNTPDGKRHVFSHFGSGSFHGIPTYLGPQFIVNPILFRQEEDVLESKGLRPLVFSHPECIVTTPFDMIINQAAENSRGSQRHGSVGVGINETVERNLYPAFSLNVAEMSVPQIFERKLYAILKDWVPQRLASLGVDEYHQKVALDFCNNNVYDKFLLESEHFNRKVFTGGIDFLKRGANAVVFEGAQGLLLDQTFGYYPYVTRGNTGLNNVVPLAEKLGIQELHVTYATRCYLTRHGAGPIHNELPNGLPYPNVKDETNVHHDFQGALRFGYLDLDRLAEAIEYDGLYMRNSPIRLVRRLAITCMDHIDQHVVWSEGGTLHGIADQEFFVKRLLKRTNSVGGFVSHGPTRADVSDFRP